MNNIIDQFFNGSLSEIIGSDFVSQTPSVNISEDENQFALQLAAPGLSKEDFELEVKDDQLSIKVHKEEDKSDEATTYMRREWSYHSFSRKFHLPNTVDRNAISGSYQDGILLVTLAKKEEAKTKASQEIVVE